MRARIFLHLAFCLAALLMLHGPAGAQAPRKSSDVVKIKATAGQRASDGTQPFTVSLDIAKGYHIYANPVESEELSGMQTVLHLRGGDAKVRYPQGQAIPDVDVGTHRVYKGQITIEAETRRRPEDIRPLEVTLRFQACDSNICLFPSEVTVKVE